MIVSKFSVSGIHVRLSMHEGYSGQPIYAVMYGRGVNGHCSFVHHTISYTRDQAIKLYYNMVLYLVWRYLHLSLKSQLRYLLSKPYKNYAY